MKQLTETRLRAPVAIGVAVAATIITLVSATTVRDGLALSAAIDLAIAGATILSFPGITSSNPVLAT